MGRKRELNVIDRTYQKTILFLASKQFFILVLMILALQALWFALTFQPTINDEPKHLGYIYFYSQHLSPFVGQQGSQWDYLGDVTRNGSYLYYYVMSLPLRLVRLLTDSAPLQIIVLRLINTGFVIGGLIYLRKAFQTFGKIPDSVLNLMLLFLVITPAFSLLAGIVNYDNLVFLAFSLVFLLAAKILKSKVINITDLVMFVALCMAITVIKWSSLSLSIPVSVFLLVDLYKKHRSSLPKEIVRKARRVPRHQGVVLGVVLLVSLLLFIERPVQNILRYGAASPKCEQTLGDARCMQSPDYAIYKDLRLHKSPDFKPLNPVSYVAEIWAPKMISSSTNLLERSTTQLPIVIGLYGVLALGSVVAILLCFRELIKDKYNLFMVIVLVVYGLSLLLVEYNGYRKYGVPAAIRARYLIPVLPFVGYLTVQSMMIMFGRYRKILATGSICLLVVLTQGAGITTYVLTTPEAYYWNNSAVHDVNSQFKIVLDPLVKN